MLFRKRPEPEPVAVPKPTVVPQGPTPTPGRRFTDKVGRSETRIGATMTLTGDIGGGDSIEVLGTVDGDISTDGLCHVGRTGRIMGRIRAMHLLVEGTVDGDIRAERKVEFRSTAKVRADVIAHTVAMAEGSQFDGRIHMEGSASGGEAGVHTSFQEKRRSESGRAE
jgi:cytoskeletal protein CcmA (bactofilin family)